MAENLIALRLFEEEKDLLDWIVFVGGYNSRSDALREALRTLGRQLGGGVNCEQLAEWSKNGRKARRSPRVKWQQVREGGDTSTAAADDPQPDIIVGGEDSPPPKGKGVR